MVAWKRPAWPSLARTTLGSSRSTSSDSIAGTRELDGARSTITSGWATDCTRISSARPPGRDQVPARDPHREPAVLVAVRQQPDLRRGRDKPVRRGRCRHPEGVDDRRQVEDLHLDADLVAAGHHLDGGRFDGDAHGLGRGARLLGRSVGDLRRAVRHRRAVGRPGFRPRPSWRRTASAATPFSVESPAAAASDGAARSERTVGRRRRPATSAVSGSASRSVSRGVLPGQERLAFDAELRARLVPGAAQLADVLVHSPSLEPRSADPTRLEFRRDRQLNHDARSARPMARRAPLRSDPKRVGDRPADRSGQRDVSRLGHSRRQVSVGSLRAPACCSTGRIPAPAPAGPACGIPAESRRSVRACRSARHSRRRGRRRWSPPSECCRPTG